MFLFSYGSLRSFWAPTPDYSTGAFKAEPRSGPLGKGPDRYGAFGHTSQSRSPLLLLVSPQQPWKERSKAGSCSHFYHR